MLFIPYVYGQIDLNTMKPHRKNPTIANVFSQIGIVEELVSGTRTIFKYIPYYSGGKEPIIEDEDIYRVEIPYLPTLQVTDEKTDQKSGLKTDQKSSLIH